MEQTELDRLADLMGVPHKNVTEFGYINDFPLFAENEPARHKLLDVLGDIALIGRPLKGKVIGHPSRSFHQYHFCQEDTQGDKASGNSGSGV